MSRIYHYYNIQYLSMIVIGAGPAGIGAVGTLLDNGHQNIIWIDPKFQNGEFQYFKSIPANTRAVNLTKFAKFFNVFYQFDNKPQYKVNVFDKYDPNVECNLDDINLCLTRMTSIIRNQFKNKVTMVQDKVITVFEKQKCFIVFTQNQKFIGEKVFLCLGANPKSFNFKPNIPRLDLYHMMSPVLIQNYDLTEQTIQLYGSSHSALLAIRNLVSMSRPPKKIYHFMNKKLVFAQYQGDFIRHNYTGLKGVTKQFGLRYQKGQFNNIVQTRYQPIPCESTKIIEAIGFEGRRIEFVPKNKDKPMEYDMKSGRLICEGREIENLYLVGLMSPQSVIDKYGQKMQAVNVYIFADYISKVIKEFKKNQVA